jgi:O-antigen/teichoic acid export membrane protein
MQKMKKICITKENGTEWELLSLPGKIFIIVAAILSFVGLFLPLSFATWIFISNKLIWTAIMVVWFFIFIIIGIGLHYRAIRKSIERMKKNRTEPY